MFFLILVPSNSSGKWNYYSDFSLVKLKPKEGISNNVKKGQSQKYIILGQ